MKSLTVTIEKYGKKTRMNIQKYCGHIACDRTKKVCLISNEAKPMITKKGLSFQCDGCGMFTDDTPFHHTLIYKGKEIKYGDW